MFQVNKQQLQTIKDRFRAFLAGETQIAADEAFCNAVNSYYEVNKFVPYSEFFYLPMFLTNLLS